MQTNNQTAQREAGSSPATLLGVVKHTQGPWHPADMDGLYCVRREPHTVLLEHASGYERNEKLANVMLAAAAPELLDALKTLLEVTYNTPDAITRRGFLTTDGDLRREQVRAAKAIAKATGETPNACVSDGPADALKSTSSAEGPFAARNG